VFQPKPRPPIVLTPAALNAQLDQLVLSQTCRAADLDGYAIAVSLSCFRCRLSRQPATRPRARRCAGPGSGTRTPCWCAPSALADVESTGAVPGRGRRGDHRRRPRSVEDRPRRHRGPVATGGPHDAVVPQRPAPTQIALRAHNPLRPSHLLQVVQTVSIGASHAAKHHATGLDPGGSQLKRDAIPFDY